MIVGPLDLGVLHPQRRPRTGLGVGSVVIYGAGESVYPVDGVIKEIPAEIWCQTPGVIGGAAAGSTAGALFLAKQLEELAGNTNLQPTYVQWTSTAGAISPSQDDGWCLLRDLQIDYTAVARGTVHFSAVFAVVNSGPPNQMGMATQGGALSSIYSGAATNWVAQPFNSTGLFGASTRTGAEGTFPIAVNPTVNPLPFVPSATISDWFKGGCHVYDAMAVIGTNPVPAAPTVLNSNWVEVFGTDHRFVGDVVISNGLLLITLSPAVSPGIVVYLWNTALGTAGWQNVSVLHYLDNAANEGTLRQISLSRIGAEEIAGQLLSGTAGSNLLRLNLRLQRGAYATRLDVDPLSQANTSSNSLYSTFPATPKVAYNSGVGATVAVVDNTLAGQATPTAPTDYGYGAAFIANSSYPFVAGWLYQNPPANQPSYNNNVNVGLGDTSGPAQNATRSYGFFAVPLVTPQNLQAEGESGSYSGANWSTAVDAAGSGGNAAKLASGAVGAHIDTFGTSWVPTPRAYIPAFRVRKGAAGSGSTVEIRLMMRNVTDATDGSVVSLSPTTATNGNLAPTTSYQWFFLPAFTPVAAKNYQFKVDNNSVTTTIDWFFDEAVLLPITNGPQEIWQQWAFDRSVRLTLG